MHKIANNFFHYKIVKAKWNKLLIGFMYRVIIIHIIAVVKYKKIFVQILVKILVKVDK